MKYACIRIDSRFNGPPHSANGGYVCGLMAATIDQPLTVRLHQPTPLDVDLSLNFDSASGKWHLLRDELLIAAAHVAHEHVHLHTHVPKAPDYEQALAASLHCSGHTQHAYPSCFVCGTARRPENGLRIFAGPVTGSRMVAAPWLPDIGLDDGQGKVRPEFIWAALDCPGYFASITTGRRSE
ncbi:MAG: hypothetical protein AB7F79_13050, partial [Steroidobacteraceae bacterium]